MHSLIKLSEPVARRCLFAALTVAAALVAGCGGGSDGSSDSGGGGGGGGGAGVPTAGQIAAAQASLDAVPLDDDTAASDLPAVKQAALDMLDPPTPQ
jgi:uncharacterized spore protein YtfJ